ncbi:hypothetical protein K1X84_01160 [bacterium]|nr:hypothetical protein [bacterium]
MKNFLSFFVKIVFSILIFFAGGELLVRFFYKPKPPLSIPENRRTAKLKDEYDPLLGWRHRPNVRVMHYIGNDSAEYKINAQGTRNAHEYSYERNSNARIVIVGDSFTFGHGVSENDRYSNMLESMLDSTEIINMGVSGYGTAQQLLYLKTEGFNYQPDLVIVGLFITNIGRNLDSINRPFLQSNGDSLIVTNFPITRPDSSLTVSDDAGENRVIGFWQKHSRFIAFLVEKFNYISRRFDPLPEYDSQHEGWQLLRKILLEIKRQCEKHGAKTLVVIIPHHTYYGGSFAQWTNQRPFDQLEKFGIENNLDVLNLLPVFKDYAKTNDWNNLVIKGDGHWNRNGHHLAAVAIKNYIDTHQLLTKRRSE